MSNIVMRNNKFEDITTHTITFLTPKTDRDAIASAAAVMELAGAMDVYYSKPIMVDRNFRPWAAKWSMIVKGTYEDIGLFRDEAKDIVEVR